MKKITSDICDLGIYYYVLKLIVKEPTQTGTM
jgi:hypothetical protein